LEEGVQDETDHCSAEPTAGVDDAICDAALGFEVLCWGYRDNLVFLS
jgi:hypothetical protein